MICPKELWKTLKETEVISKYGLNVVWIKRTTPDGKEILMVSGPDDIVNEGDTLFILGDDKAIEGFKKLKT